MKAFLFCLLISFHFLAGVSNKTFDFQESTNHTKRARQCTSSFGAKTLLHLPTNEGLISHIFQLNVLWYLSRNIHLNKIIIEVPFESEHFPGEIVSACDIFELPSDIICSCDSIKRVGRVQKYCPMLGIDIHNTWAIQANMYGMKDSQTAVIGNVDLFNESCNAGMLNYLQYMPRYRATMKGKTDPTMRFPVKFTPVYLKLVEVIRSMELQQLDLHHQDGTKRHHSISRIDSLPCIGGEGISCLLDAKGLGKCPAITASTDEFVALVRNTTFCICTRTTCLFLLPPTSRMQLI